MTDYLEEHLENAEALLRRIRQMEQSGSGLSPKIKIEEEIKKLDDYDEKERIIDQKNGIVSINKKEVYDLGNFVYQQENMVDIPGIDPKTREKEPDTLENGQIKTGDNDREPEQPEAASKTVEQTQTNAERAENRPALSAQLEELDRTVSVLTALAPEGQGSARGGYPVSLPLPQAAAADLNATGIPDEAWSGVGAAVRADFSYGGTQSWAEQADRAFRRDSRRYDGGFYLY